MQRILILIYIIVITIIAFYVTILEIQPALFLLDLMATNPGDEYSLSFVFAATELILLLPLMFLLLIIKGFRRKSAEIIGVDRTGVFVTRQKSFQSAIVGIPIYINSKKAGIVDNGKTKFFDVPLGYFTIQAGEGKQASEIIEAKTEERDQLNFEFKPKQAGLFIKIELAQIETNQTI